MSKKSLDTSQVHVQAMTEWSVGQHCAHRSAEVRLPQASDAAGKCIFMEGFWKGKPGRGQTDCTAIIRRMVLLGLLDEQVLKRNRKQSRGAHLRRAAAAQTSSLSGMESAQRGERTATHEQSNVQLNSCGVASVPGFVFPSAPVASERPC